MKNKNIKFYCILDTKRKEVFGISENKYVIEKFAEQINLDTERFKYVKMKEDKIGSTFYEYIIEQTIDGIYYISQDWKLIEDMIYTNDKYIEDNANRIQNMTEHGQCLTKKQIKFLKQAKEKLLDSRYEEKSLKESIVIQMLYNDLDKLTEQREFIQRYKTVLNNNY